MNRILKVIDIGILGILSFFPIALITIFISSIFEIGQGKSFPEINSDFLYRIHVIAPIMAFVMGIYFIIYIARTKRFHVITSVAWMIFLIIPYLNFITVPAFWIFLLIKEIQGNSNEVATLNSDTAIAESE